MKVRWLKAGTRSLRLVHARIAYESPVAAKSVVERIRATVKPLGQFPQAGRQGHVTGTRELVVQGIPYVVVYRIAGEAVEILRVFHTARNWTELQE